MITKDFYASSCLMSLVAALASAPAYSTPLVSAVVGDITQDQTITIQGSGFTSKANAKPVFWWRADDSENGQAPSALGRKTAWDNSAVFNGEPSQLVVAPGSQQSVAWDHGLSDDAALTRLDITSERLFIHRKLYEDFDIVKDVAIRTLVDTASITGTINIGDTITGQTSGATGVVVAVYPPASDPTAGTTIAFTNTTGTVAADESSRKDFQTGEIMAGPGYTMTNIDAYGGVQRSFNYKPIRYWYYEPPYNDILVAAQGIENRAYRISPEFTDNTVYLTLEQTPDRWNYQEVEYRASDIDVDNGQWNFFQNGVSADTSLITRATDRPGLFYALFQGQVSNGAQPGSIVYYDSLYIDDTWHRVMICRSRQWAECAQPEVQIPTSWDDGQITVQLNFGGLSRTSSLFLYVFDENGVPNAEGFALCPKCPLQPTVQ